MATIHELKARGDALAMVISDQRMPGLQGTDVLGQSRDVYPLARRVMLTAYSDIDATIKAINVAHLDHYLSKPWAPPEECLFPVIDDLLDAWQAEYLPEAKGLRLVGYQWAPRSHEIKDFLAGNLIPYRWLDVARAETRSLLDSAGIDVSELPALLFEDGSRCGIPNPARWPSASADPSRRPISCTTWSSWVPVPRVSQPPCTGRRKDCEPCCSIGTRPADRRAPVPASRTIWGFPRVSAAAS